MLPHLVRFLVVEVTFLANGFGKNLCRPLEAPGSAMLCFGLGQQVESNY
jgi:hypothetical protein